MSDLANILEDFDTSIGKIEDAGNVVTGGGIDRYWERQGIDKKITKLFGGKTLKHDWLADSNIALNNFNLRSIEFGNWMSQKDRANFLYGSMLSLHHLAKLFDVDDKQIGMKGKLSIALGARGRGGRVAGHYEPNPYAVINLTKTMGVTVLSNKFAHALDNIISFYVGAKRQTYASGGRTTRKGFNENIFKNGNWFEKQFEEFFNILYFDKQGNETDFYENIKDLDEYWQRRNEVFARTFEIYTQYHLAKLGIKNTFIAKKSYAKYTVYPSEKLMLKVAPIIEKIAKKGFALMKKSKPLGGIKTPIGYKGFRTVLKQSGNVNDTLKNMQRIARRDVYQVANLAETLKGANVGETSKNIWNYLRENTRYKLDENGIEQLRTPTRSLVDGKKAITNPRFGIDCDDYTILVSAMLLHLGIRHEYRVTAYKEKGRFQHIYPVAFDSLGQKFVIDIVPEIPHFNYEAKPIIDLKKIPMEIHELSGIDEAEPITQNELVQDVLEDLNQPFDLSGIEETDEDDEIFESSFLSGFGEVYHEDEAEIILNGTNDAIDLLETGILAEVTKARQTLIKERETPTALSQSINITKELSHMNAIVKAWANDAKREQVIENAIINGSSFANFFKAIQLSLDQLNSESLAGMEDEFDEPIYLARVDMENYKLENLLDENNGVGIIGQSRLGFLKRFFKKVGRGIKRGVKKVGKFAKKALKAVVRFNPATALIRASIRLVLKLNLFKIAQRLIYGYLSEAQAKKQGLDLNEWRKLVRAKNRAEKFYKRLGGRGSKFRKAIVRGKARKKTGLQLGAVATASGTAAASGFIVFIKKILASINPAKLFKKVFKRKNSSGNQTTFPTNDMSFNDSHISNDFDSNNTNNSNIPRTKMKFTERVKTFFSKHKKKIIVSSLLIVISIVAVIFYKKNKKKKKRSLAGIKSARTRARNRKRNLSGVSTRPAKLLPTPRKSRTTTSKRTVAGLSAGQKRNTARLKKMHSKAKELQKQHPRTKYSTLLKKASAMV